MKIQYTKGTHRIKQQHALDHLSPLDPVIALVRRHLAALILACIVPDRRQRLVQLTADLVLLGDAQLGALETPARVGGARRVVHDAFVMPSKNALAESSSLKMPENSTSCFPHGRNALKMAKNHVCATAVGWSTDLAHSKFF